MNNYYAQFGGGLGDVFHQIFTGPYWHLLRDLLPEDRVRCALICHNPYARELFEWHPKRAQIDLLDLGYWGWNEDREKREKYNLPYSPIDPPFSTGPIDFYISNEEAMKLAEFRQQMAGKPYVLFSATAGQEDRTFPHNLAMELLTFLTGYVRVVIVGRNYIRLQRQQEWRASDLLDLKYSANVFDMVDAFSVPGVANLLIGSAGLVTCHSSLNLLGWHLRKPQLLLYPESVRQRHFLTPDGCSFGIQYPETVHSLYENYSQDVAKQFIEKLSIKGSANCSLF